MFWSVSELYDTYYSYFDISLRGFCVATLKKALKQLIVDMHSRDFDCLNVYER